MNRVALFDTHTHFDIAEYDDGRDFFNKKAYAGGVRHLVLIGYLAKYFERMANVKQMADRQTQIPAHHNAFGLHPLYIKEHNEQDLATLDTYLKKHQSIAIAEIGLDTYPNELKEESLYQKQQRFFVEQVRLAKAYDLPIMLHIRKAHADVLKILKNERYNPIHQGGIAHSFSGGENEALAFVKMGFKLGITGQITNPNAKKLRTAVMAVYRQYGISAFVIETDCPDMMPVPCQHAGYFNEPSNLIYVLDELARLFDINIQDLAEKLWHNTNVALKQNFTYPLYNTFN